MNPTDRKLLALLKTNARLSTSELARRLNLSRSTVQNRITRLEESGIIRGYTLVYDEDYEKRLISAHVLLKVVQKLTTKTNQDLQAISQVTGLYSISGDFDVMIVVQAETTQELNQVLDAISQLKGVERTNSSLILETKLKR